VSVHSLSDPSLSSMRAGLRTAALNLLTAFWRSPVRQYRPEAHYMRGPGSKWSEKHGRNREARVSSGDRKFLNGSGSIGSQKHRPSHVIATDATWKLSADRAVPSRSNLCAPHVAGRFCGACELSKAGSRTSGELQQNAEHPPETDPNIPNDRRNLVKHDHINRHERCNGGEECAGGAR
jgi:hypothetical protein